MRKIYEAAVIFLGTLGWWGFVYPDLCLTEDVYEQEAQQQEEASVEKAAGEGRPADAEAESGSASAGVKSRPADAEVESRSESAETESMPESAGAESGEKRRSGSTEGVFGRRALKSGAADNSPEEGRAADESLEAPGQGKDVPESGKAGEAGADRSEAEHIPGEGWRIGGLRIKSRIVEYVYQVRGNTAAKDRGD